MDSQCGSGPARRPPFPSRTAGAEGHEAYEPCTYMRTGEQRKKRHFIVTVEKHDRATCELAGTARRGHEAASQERPGPFRQTLEGANVPRVEQSRLTCRVRVDGRVSRRHARYHQERTNERQHSEDVGRRGRPPVLQHVLASRVCMRFCLSTAFSPAEFPSPPTQARLLLC